jgi:prefoldin subunit 5
VTPKLTPKIRNGNPDEYKEEQKTIEQRITELEKELKTLRSEMRALKNGEK